MNFSTALFGIPCADHKKGVFEAGLKAGNDKLDWPAGKGSKHEPQVSLVSDIKSMQGKRISENR